MVFPPGENLGQGRIGLMLPKPPPRDPSLGFLYLPPYRLFGESIAGETTCLQIPELDLGFDMGAYSPRPILP